MSFWTGSPAQYEQVSTLTPAQQKLHAQQISAARQAMPQAQSYYQGLMSDNPWDMQAMAAPEMRRFNEDIIPGLAEQFAGMGSGGLSSSGFRNAAVSAGTDLSERLGAIRAQLRQSGAAGLQNMAGQGLQNVTERVMTDPGSGGFLAAAAPIAGAALGAFGGPLLGALGTGAANWLMGKNQQSPVANQGPSAKPMTQGANYGGTAANYPGMRR